MSNMNYKYEHTNIHAVLKNTEFNITSYVLIYQLPDVIDLLRSTMQALVIC